MSVIYDEVRGIFSQKPYDREDVFEADVVRLADQLFGPESIYVDIKRKIGNDVVTIPDGYLIDTTEPDNPKLFVVENEIVSHDPFKHIGIQLLKFATGFDEAQRGVREFLMSSIRSAPTLLERIETSCSKSSSPNIDHYLDRAVYGDFRALVVIDEARPELYRVLEKINANISVLELKRFETEDGQMLFQFDTLYDEFEEAEEEFVPEPGGIDSDRRAKRQSRRAAADTIVVPAREDGFQKVFLGANQWYPTRIGAAMKDRIKHIAAYQVAPVGAVTHIADVQDIKPYRDSGKYLLTFKAPAQKIAPIPLGATKAGLKGPVYVEREKLLRASSLREALSS
jgi:hypothetical protein